MHFEDRRGSALAHPEKVRNIIATELSLFLPVLVID